MQVRTGNFIFQPKRVWKYYIFSFSCFNSLLLQGLQVCGSMDFGISHIFFSCCLFRVWTWLCLNVPLHAEPAAAAFKAPTEVEPGTETQQWEQHHQHCQQVASRGGLERAARGREHTLKQKCQAHWPQFSNTKSGATLNSQMGFFTTTPGDWAF